MKSLFLLLAAACCLHAGEAAPAVVTGRVSDPSGAVVPGAAIKLTNRANAEEIVAGTDHNGVFRVASLPPGSYGLAAEAAGFAPLLQNLDIQPGEKKDLELSLQVAAMNEQVTVTAKAPPGEDARETSSRNSREVLEIREVRESAAKDLGEALSKLEGLTMIRKGGIANDVVLRGFQQGNIDILIDGQRIYGACPGHMDPAAYHVDFAEVETVEVTKGPFDIRNQGSLGGTVNVVSKDPEAGFHLVPSFGASSFGFYNPSLTGSFSKGRIHGLAGYSYRRSDPYVDGSGRATTAYANYSAAGRDRPAFDINTGWARIGVDLAPNQSMELSFTRQSGGLTLYPALQMDAPYDRANRGNFNWSRRELTGLVKAVRVQGYFSEVSHWMTDELRTGAAGTPLGYSMGSFAGSRALGGRIEAELPDTILGVEAYDRGWSVVGSMLMKGMYSAQPSLPDVRMIVGGFYAQHRRSFGRLALAFGGRVDAASSAALSKTLSTDLYWAYHNTRSTQATDANPSANFRLTYLLPAGIEWFAGVGSTVRLPDPEERYYSSKGMTSDWVGNPTLAPTRNNEADLGINLRARRFSLRPTLFYSRLENFVAISQEAKLNMIAGSMTSSARSYEGVAARIYGGEVSYSMGFGRSLLLSGGVSYTRGIEFAKPEAGMPKGNIAEMPPLKSRASLRYGRSLFFAEIDGLASALQDKVDPRVHEQRTPGYALLGVKGGIHRKQWNLAAGVDNLLDRFYYSHLSYTRDPYRSGVRIPEPGRTLYLNVSYRFE
ncbi:MAG: TonB-dependent receptor [Acidobacteriia bacterium]|nr:TonB-dependent receptor [Terriglobia bacterium]